VAGEQLLRATLGDEEGYGADDDLYLGPEIMREI
jgi:hypothetical protein